MTARKQSDMLLFGYAYVLRWIMRNNLDMQAPEKAISLTARSMQPGTSNDAHSSASAMEPENLTVRMAVRVNVDQQQKRKEEFLSWTRIRILVRRHCIAPITPRTELSPTRLALRYISLTLQDLRAKRLKRNTGKDQQSCWYLKSPPLCFTVQICLLKAVKSLHNTTKLFRLSRLRHTGPHSSSRHTACVHPTFGISWLYR